MGAGLLGCYWEIYQAHTLYLPELPNNALYYDAQCWLAYALVITADNGKEFTGHKAISKALGVDF